MRSETLRGTAMTWVDGPDGVLTFRRETPEGGEVLIVVNVTAESVPLPAYDEVLVASGALDDIGLPADTAVWLRV